MMNKSTREDNSLCGPECIGEYKYFVSDFSVAWGNLRGLKGHRPPHQNFPYFELIFHLDIRVHSTLHTQHVQAALDSLLRSNQINPSTWVLSPPSQSTRVIFQDKTDMVPLSSP